MPLSELSLPWQMDYVNCPIRPICLDNPTTSPWKNKTITHYPVFRNDNDAAASLRHHHLKWVNGLLGGHSGHKTDSGK
ncbi:MAG: hypothetical protein VSS75_008275 [Candidatus Parabeggiatoa sp.]|nr:hypothetical protein [Candidatus Parabeggiatoa sp.]